MSPEAKKLHGKLKLSNIRMQTKEAPRKLGILTYAMEGGFTVVICESEQGPVGSQDFKTLDDVLKTWEEYKP
jgi:hypothetical protein